MGGKRIKNIAFVHPDLGLGGAERLVVDAATVLAEQGHEVTIYTAFHDPQRCFKETLGGGFTVTVSGGWFPRNIVGRAHALRKRQYDIVFADQVSAVVPFLHAFTSARVVFYCHHPDLLLTHRAHNLQKAYRLPLDWIEEQTTGQADKVLVNSAYTAEIFQATFRRLSARGLAPDVLHPCCHVPSERSLENTNRQWRSLLPQELVTFLEGKFVFLSINRFERKKDVGLAVRAFHQLLQLEAAARSSCRLVLAGGYDARLQENREYFSELQDLLASLGLEHKVRMLPSFSDQQKAGLLAAAAALLYTPVNEHFGIVPLEAMAACRPVIACDSGGPRETVLHCQTGFLCRPQPDNFAAAMLRLQASKEDCQTLGLAARKHVLAHFSRAAFAAKLEATVQELSAGGPQLQK